MPVQFCSFLHPTTVLFGCPHSHLQVQRDRIFHGAFFPFFSPHHPFPFLLILAERKIACDIQIWDKRDWIREKRQPIRLDMPDFCFSSMWKQYAIMSVLCVSLFQKKRKELIIMNNLKGQENTAQGKLRLWQGQRTC